MAENKEVVAWEQHDAGQGGPYETSNLIDVRQKLITQWENDIADWENTMKGVGPEQKVIIQSIIDTMNGILNDIRSIGEDPK